MLIFKKIKIIFLTVFNWLIITLQEAPFLTIFASISEMNNYHYYAMMYSDLQPSSRVSQIQLKKQTN